jgi:arginyl-tRNA synthetase
MIIYGYKHFVDRAKYQTNPVAELGRLYKFVHRVVDYRESVKSLPVVSQRLTERSAELDRLKAQPKSGDKTADKAADKKAAQALAKAQEAVRQLTDDVAALKAKIATIENEPQLAGIAAQHANIDEAVLEETAKLHADDAENLRLWHEFLPNCRDEIARVYRRLGVTFDHELGESFYHDRLSGVVAMLREKGLAQNSQGAVCVFIDGFDTPMIVQKKDGAFLYSTTDIATIQYRLETWQPSVILYVVDHRQSEHFDKLFAVARQCGYEKVRLEHLKFGTVMGTDGRPYKTREGTAAGLEALLDEAVSRALAVVSETDTDNHLSAEQRREIAEVIGIGALKYADLSQNRTSDYTFSYDKMLLMNGNTATYMQYSYARVRSIFTKGEIDPAELRASSAKIILTTDAERALGVQLLRFAEALAEIETEFMPHYLTGYLFDLAKAYSTFFEKCPVLKAETDQLKRSRLLLCDLTARTIRLGLSLLGIEVVERM